MPDLVRARESGAPVVLRHPDAVRPWQHVLGPLAGYLLLAERLAESDECATRVELRPGRTTRGRCAGSWTASRERWALDVRVRAGGATASRRRCCAWTPRRRASGSAGRRALDLAAGLDATVFWHDQVRAGHDARAVTLTQIEDAS